eukprot:TRINITY_DN1797_c1_g3_i2.p1 TRINITY_DN1797_c1_g3~~TRINITY_DN1797_c1_g3_i2.p1  ORF type:complete len:121 (-),score=53.04 TRINITY_DN1797_c1_g3_i2:39-401(-)
MWRNIKLSLDTKMVSSRFGNQKYHKKKEELRDYSSRSLNVIFTNLPSLPCTSLWNKKRFTVEICLGRFIVGPLTLGVETEKKGKKKRRKEKKKRRKEKKKRRRKTLQKEKNNEEQKKKRT